MFLVLYVQTLLQEEQVGAQDLTKWLLWIDFNPLGIDLFVEPSCAHTRISIYGIGLPAIGEPAPHQSSALHCLQRHGSLFKAQFGIACLTPASPSWPPRFTSCIGLQTCVGHIVPAKLPLCRASHSARVMLLSSSSSYLPLPPLRRPPLEPLPPKRPPPCMENLSDLPFGDIQALNTPGNISLFMEVSTSLLSWI